MTSRPLPFGQSVGYGLGNGELTEEPLTASQVSVSKTGLEKPVTEKGPQKSSRGRCFAPLELPGLPWFSQAMQGHGSDRRAEPCPKPLVIKDLTEVNAPYEELNSVRVI